MNTKDDQKLTALIKQATAGDKAALETVLSAVQDLVFNLSLRMLGITPEAYRQRLSRTRKKMAQFLSEYCGEYGQGACRCADRVNYAIQDHRISPSRLDFTAAKPSNTTVEVTAAMEEIDGYAQQFSFCRAYQSTERLKQMIRDFLNGPAFSTVAEAQGAGR